jgi:hypothetical protein
MSSREAAFIAKNKFHDRKVSDLSIELEDWIDDDRKKVTSSKGSSKVNIYIHAFIHTYMYI